MLRPTRLLALGAAVAVGFLYWSPLRSYEHTSALLRSRDHQVATLQAEAHDLRTQIASVGSGAGFVQEARRLGYVEPGQQLFIVRGIPAWRAHH